ncbi:FAD-dependent oxidoreductase [Actinomadura sp. HBU206391]|uniref:FAD-dependent oxidoreductase n=1 Tax=Actinomadura sp. HBU206391 TaxID=2731692 RepID=UPI0016506225|nr:FAD-dependent monooxygenase [Actinomadura sp. HBU206391]MBC6459390.1 FAD-dependent monooxygenase [Actinomadura sp. HBU206391]
MPESRDHAVVIGGSLAGLLAARVLTGHFTRVTIVERDRFPETPDQRPGVPQGHHLHVLWTRGLELLEELFPGFEEEMRAAGAPNLHVPRDVLWLTAAGWRQRFEVTRMLTFGRGLLDWILRGRLAKEVELMTGHEVTGLIPRGGGVGGVVVRERGETGADEPLHADFVVDASGRGARTPGWLAELGYPAPPETLVDPLLGYASRQYAVPEGFDADWTALYLQADPPATRRTGGLFPMEGGRWMCSLSGAGRDYGPTDEAAFLDFAKGLRSPVLYEAIRDAEPLTPIMGFRHTANRRRHYDRLRAWPERFVVMGDAVCTFDPIYGQGMSVAALQAVALDQWLRGRAGTREFQRRAARVGSGAWLIATGEDLRYAETEGPPIRLRTKVINRYVSSVVAAADVDRRVCAQLLDVLALRSRPESLFLPPVLLRVMTAGRSTASREAALVGGADPGPPPRAMSSGR